MYKVMIVDDVSVFRKQLKRLKVWEEQNDFIVDSEASNGVEALDKLEHTHIDVVITDIKMHKMDGIELLQEIKSRDLCRCVILLSEYTDFEFARQGIVLGAFDYILKPVDYNKIFSVLERTREFLSSSNKNLYPTEEEKVLIQCILKTEPLFKEKVNLLLKLSNELMNKNFVKTSLLIAKVAFNVYNEILIENPWIKHIASDINKLKEKINTYEDIYIVSMAFEEYMRELYAIINKYRVGKDNNLVLKVCNYILNHPDMKISLGDMANICFTNKSYLSHIFKQETNMSFVDYITMLKMDRAKKIFVETDLKIFEVADKLGYDDPEYFSKLFKNTLGVSPSKYKKVMMN